jgi:uncharacterized protein
MRKLTYLISFMFIVASTAVMAQHRHHRHHHHGKHEDEKTYVQNLTELRAAKDKKFKEDDKSPLTGEQQKSFKGLNYYPIDTKWKIDCEFKKIKNQVPFKMTFSDGKDRMYVKYGVLYFKVDGEEYQLTAYMDFNMPKRHKKRFEDYLFIPFKDLTNGEETFGGGRYIEWHKPDHGHKGFIDFNLAFNPVCVYNPKTRCPIPPDENFINVKILAGEKDFH